MRLDYGYRKNATRGFVHTLERFASTVRLQVIRL